MHNSDYYREQATRNRAIVAKTCKAMAMFAKRSGVNSAPERNFLIGIRPAEFP
jgi:hypothetical protein